jgi:hypothetical protein
MSTAWTAGREEGQNGYAGGKIRVKTYGALHARGTLALQEELANLLVGALLETALGLDLLTHSVVHRQVQTNQVRVV